MPYITITSGFELDWSIFYCGKPRQRQGQWYFWTYRLVHHVFSQRCLLSFYRSGRSMWWASQSIDQLTHTFHKECYSFSKLHFNFLWFCELAQTWYSQRFCRNHWRVICLQNIWSSCKFHGFNHKEVQYFRDLTHSSDALLASSFEYSWNRFCGYPLASYWSAQVEVMHFWRNSPIADFWNSLWDESEPAKTAGSMLGHWYRWTNC